VRVICSQHARQRIAQRLDISETDVMQLVGDALNAGSISRRPPSWSRRHSYHRLRRIPKGIGTRYVRIALGVVGLIAARGDVVTLVTVYSREPDRRAA
jgi:hypothetical protein